MSIKKKTLLVFLGILILAAVSGLVANPKSPNLEIHQWGVDYSRILKYRLGLDLQGGTQLVYQGDLSGIPPEGYSDAMNGVRDVIERRVNLFGVSEPDIRVENVDRLSVELAGVKDIDEAIRVIGEMPTLDFRELLTKEEIKQILTAQNQDASDEKVNELYGSAFKPTGLSGKHLMSARVEYLQSELKYVVAIKFNEEGTKLFADVTTRNVGQPLAIYLDNQLTDAPRVEQPLTDGSAIISGNFTSTSAKLLAQRLNAGALPVPIKLIDQQGVSASLGKDSLSKSMFAGAIGFLIVALFMIIYYRLPGLLSVFALIIYTLIILALFKLIPITLTLAGIAGFILSVGMAVDANVLIFERTREELRRGKSLSRAIDEGFNRAWPSIRDSNITTLITGAALFWFGTGLIKGFAITLTMGVLISMFSALTVTKTFLKLVSGPQVEKHPFLFGIAKKENKV